MLSQLSNETLRTNLSRPANDIGFFGTTAGALTALSGGIFTAASIKARTDALTLIGLYAQRLSDLAGSDAPTQFSNNVQALGASLSRLDDTFSKINSAHDANAKTYVAPVTALVLSPHDYAKLGITTNSKGSSIRGVDHLRKRFSKRTSHIQKPTGTFVAEKGRMATKREVEIFVRESREDKLTEVITPGVWLGSVRN